MTAYLPRIFRKRQLSDDHADVGDTATRLRQRYESSGASPAARAAAATTLVNEYYDIVTDFYEYGWGPSFHFATRFAGESFRESLVRHEHFVALEGQFRHGHKILDIGCGVGGPARAIAQFSGARVTGINNNAYQISLAQRYGADQGMTSLVDYVRADFSKMPLEAEQYDGAYAIEATCHAQSRTACFAEVWRCLRPGSYFVLYEWVTTDVYDDSNDEHRRIRHGIELGDGLPTLTGAAAVVGSMREAGFEVEEAFDVIQRDRESGMKLQPWYHPLEGNYHSLSGLKASPVGRLLTATLCTAMEMVRIAPKGSRQAADILEEAAVSLVSGGKLGIFTPAYFVKGRKPLLPSATKSKIASGAVPS